MSMRIIYVNTLIISLFHLDNIQLLIAKFLLYLRNYKNNTL